MSESGERETKKGKGGGGETPERKGKIAAFRLVLAVGSDDGFYCLERGCDSVREEIKDWREG